MEDKDKHYYEVVIDEHHCHLYLDVEFYYEFNPNLLSKETIILELLKDMICLAISDKYSITITSKDILDLDSSTATKFSCHLIIRIPNSCFINNINCGNFVKYLILQIETYLKHDSNLELLFVHNDKNKRVFIADLGMNIQTGYDLIIMKLYTVRTEIFEYSSPLNMEKKLFLHYQIETNVDMIIMIKMYF